jgi:5-methylcytosine-specific restriction endonuclease McrA
MIDKLPTSMTAAKAIKAPFYYTGRPCSRGHLAKRRTGNGTCSACKNAWRPTVFRDAVAKACAKCGEVKPPSEFYDHPVAKDRKQGSCRQCVAIAHRLRMERPGIREKRNAYFREYGRTPHRRERQAIAVRKPERLAKVKEYNQRPEVKERVARGARARRALNPLPHRADSKNRKALKRAGRSSVSTKQIVELLALAKKCPDCGRRFCKARPKTIDHVMALSRGGEHRIDNLRVICGSCNSSKSARAFSSNGQGILL